MVSVPINEPERERPKRTGVELFEATPDQLPPQNLEAEEVILGGSYWIPMLLVGWLMCCSQKLSI